jgi:hypothetical protein
VRNLAVTVAAGVNENEHENVSVSVMRLKLPLAAAAARGWDHHQDRLRDHRHPYIRETGRHSRYTGCRRSSDLCAGDRHRRLATCTAPSSWWLAPCRTGRLRGACWWYWRCWWCSRDRGHGRGRGCDRSHSPSCSGLRRRRRRRCRRRCSSSPTTTTLSLSSSSCCLSLKSYVTKNQSE